MSILVFVDFFWFPQEIHDISDIRGNPWIFMDIYRNPWKSMDIQEYSSISKKSWILPDNLEILIFQISMEIRVCPSYHTWISNMVLLEKLVMTSIFKTQTPGRIHRVRLPMVIYH